MNAKVERLNRTTQEEFYIRYKSLLWDNIEAFNKKLVKWVLWYNTERPHWSLKFLSPLKFYCREIFKQKYNLDRTYTYPFNLKWLMINFNTCLIKKQYFILNKKIALFF